MDEFDTPEPVDQVVVLVVSGSTLIECRDGAHWRSTAHVPGNVGMTGPGQVQRMRWRGPQRHQTLHLHLPATTMEAAFADAADAAPWIPAGVNSIAGQEPVVASVMTSLVRASREGAPDMLAASAAHFLARHVLLNDLRDNVGRRTGGEAARLQRVDDFMIAHLSSDLTLHDLADAGDCTTFQLIRFAKLHWGETPFQRLTRLRMERARHLLRDRDDGIMSVALDCGYSNPSHFAIAFRRIVGLSPTEFRES